MNAAELKAQDFHPLAGPYSPEEAPMLNRVVADLKRGGIAYKLVSEIGGTSVWRKGWVELPDPTRSITNRTRR